MNISKSDHATVAHQFIAEHPGAAELVHDIISERRKHGLTRQQREVLNFIAGFINTHGFSPTLREIRSHMGWSSMSITHRVVSSLEERGHLRRLKGRARAIELA